MNSIALVNELYAHHALGDVDSAVADCVEDFHFLLVASPELTPYSGSFRGRVAFRDQLRKMHDLFIYRSFSPVDFIADGDRVASRSEIRLTRRTTGQEFMIPAADFWTIRDGRIAELIEYCDTALIARMI